MRTIRFSDLGLAEYGVVWEKQELLMNEVIGQKTSVGMESAGYLLFVEHLPVFTLGKSGEAHNLLLNSTELADKKVSFYKTNRGGDITFHGPGQLVGYPILDLEKLGKGLRQYIYSIEEILIRVLSQFGIVGSRDPNATGVWLDVGLPTARKIAAIGVKSSRHVTMHGFALNVNTDLDYFRYIHPCGIVDKGVTSMAKEMTRSIDFDLVKKSVLSCFSSEFDVVFDNTAL
jgi:lipoyl(octanoyl) transferase